MKRLSILCATLIISVLAISTTAMAISTSSTPKKELLYVIHAKTGNLISTQQKDQYRLMLQQPIISYFTDRPGRESGKVTVEKFTALWKTGPNSFKQDHPNAALIAGIDALNSDSQAVNNFVVLSQPDYNSATHTLTFNARNLHPNNNLSSGHFHDVVLFIDSTTDCQTGDLGCM